ncbi:MAG: site-specific DNA-methyltransferase [Armatimonadetes bacterium]|nr:site-specific DNA-methyltransferase [Armatimonadota bacterium]
MHLIFLLPEPCPPFLSPVARKLIEMLSEQGDTVFDPFCGSGTVTTEAVRLGRHAIGFDINPLALLIAEVKATPIMPQRLWQALAQIESNLRRLGEVEPPKFANIDYWFKPEVQKQLARLKAAIDALEGEAVKKFSLIVFSRVVREASNTRPNEFKLFRLPPEKLKRHNPDVFRLFHQRFAECIGIMSDWWREVGDSLLKPQLRLHDARQPFPLPSESVDLLLTSPPYGDARTTVAYGQFSRLSLQWLGLWREDLDRISLGGHHRSMKVLVPTLKEALEAIAKVCPKRAQEVEAFYADLYDCLRNIVPIVKRDGFAVFVIANRKVRGIKLPTDKIIVEMLPEFEFVVSLPRQIPNKRMPLRNSPSNIPGETDTTMLEEHIVILQKKTVLHTSAPAFHQLRLLERKGRYQGQ